MRNDVLHFRVIDQETKIYKERKMKKKFIQIFKTAEPKYIFLNKSYLEKYTKINIL